MDQGLDNDITALTRQTYDRIAGDFAESVWSITEVGERLVRFADYLLSLGNDASELRVLDAGCGPGRVEGTLYLGVKEGEGEAVRGRDEGKPRFFTYFTENELRTLVTKAGFRVVDSGHGRGVSNEGLPWLHLFAVASEYGE